MRAWSEGKWKVFALWIKTGSRLCDWQAGPSLRGLSRTALQSLQQAGQLSPPVSAHSSRCSGLGPRVGRQRTPPDTLNLGLE
eukprot:1824095-Rhodomonas_salina.1